MVWTLLLFPSMKTHLPLPHRHTGLFLGLFTLFMLEGAGCIIDNDNTPPPTATPDPRVGFNKKVRFVGGGCSGAESVLMPIGGKDTLELQAADTSIMLPDDLSAQSTDPSVIAVSPGTDPFSIDMQALKTGKTDVELMSAGQRFDWLTFFAEPAKAVNFTAEPAVIEGGRLGLGISDVFGSCGNEDCVMFGHSFIQWSVSPSMGLALLKDELAIAHFTAGMTPENAEIIGKEPSLGGELVRHPIEVVDPATITGLSGQLTVLSNSNNTGNQEEPMPVPFPATVPAGSSFTVRVEGLRTGKSAVAVSRHDVVWSTPAGIDLVPQNEPADTVAELFTAGSTTGSFSIKATVALLGGMEQSFSITIVPAM